MDTIDLEARLDAARAAAYERRRPAATARARARLDAERAETVAFYTGRPLVDGAAPSSPEEAQMHVDNLYAPDSPNFAERVEQEMAAMAVDPTLAPPMEPVPPFEATDWTGTEVTLDDRGQAFVLTASGRAVRADERLERKIDPAVEEAERYHHLHTAHVHPWCVPCAVREVRTPYSGNDVLWAARSDAEVAEEARVTAEARVRHYLARHDGVAPKHPLSLEPVAHRPVWHSEGDLAQMDPPEWLVDGLLPAQGVGYIIGRDGVKKTFLALDLALSICTGHPFHGREVHDEAYSGALFVAGEGVSSFGARIEAWRAARQRPRSTSGDAEAPLTVRSGGVNLYKRDAGFLELLERVAKHQPDLVVFDTLQRCAQGADQNSAADMAIVTASLDEVKHASGGMVLVIAHTDKGDNDARGSSSIEDDADFVLHLKDRDGIVEARVTKQKDGESGSTLRLVGEAHAGSIALVAADQAQSTEAARGSSPRLRILNALRLAHGEHLDVEGVWRAATTREAPIAKGSVDNLLRTMADAGDVRREQVGPKRKAFYWLDPVLDGAESQEG